MKRIPGFISLLTIFIIFCSCKDKEEPIGKWDDNILLSARTVNLGANADSVIIKTKRDCWWITGVSVNNKNFSVYDGLDYQGTDYSASDRYSIKEDCFVVERRDKNTLFIKVDSNHYNVKRIISVGLEAGDYFDRVTITQAAK